MILNTWWIHETLPSDVETSFQLFLATTQRSWFEKVHFTRLLSSFSRSAPFSTNQNQPLFRDHIPLQFGHSTITDGKVISFWLASSARSPWSDKSAAPETPRDISRDLKINHSEPAFGLAINVYPYLSSWSWHYNAANNEETLTDWWGTVLASSSAKVRSYRLIRSGGSLIARLLSDGVQKNQQLLNLPWVSDSSYSIFLVFQIWFTMNAERVTRKIDTPKTSLVLMGRPTIMSIDDRFCSRSIWSHYIGRVMCRFQSTSRRSVQNNNCGESLKHPVLIWSKRSWCGGRIIMTWHFHCSKKPNTPRNWQTSRLPTYIFKYQVRWQTRVTSKTISKELTPRHRWTCFQHMPRYEVNRLSKNICHNNHSRQQILRSQPNLIN